MDSILKTYNLIEDRYVGKSFTPEFLIPYDIANCIIQEEVPEKASENVCNYTIDSYGEKTLLIGLNKVNYVEFVHELQCTQYRPFEEYRPILQVQKDPNCLVKALNWVMLIVTVLALGFGIWLLRFILNL